MSIPSPLLLTTPFADALTKVDRVIDALNANGINISPCNSVGSLFAKVRQLNKQHAKNPGQYDAMKFFPSIEAIWIAEALEMAIGNPGSCEAIRRIVGSEMDLSV